MAKSIPLDQWCEMTGFTPEYSLAMQKVEKAKCEHCGISIMAHAVREIQHKCRAIQGIPIDPWRQ